jgi:hypothetical protein
MPSGAADGALWADSSALANSSMGKNASSRRLAARAAVSGASTAASLMAITSASPMP